MRWLIPQPCSGASDSAFNTRRSSVPCSTSDDAATCSPVECSRESTWLLSNGQGSDGTALLRGDREVGSLRIRADRDTRIARNVDGPFVHRTAQLAHLRN